MTEIKEAPDFAIQDFEFSSKGKTVTAELVVENDEQREWLINKIGLQGRLAENALENAIEANVVLKCNGECKVFVDNTTTLYTINHSVDSFDLNKEEQTRFANFLVDTCEQWGKPIPRWLNEMTYPPIDAPSFDLSGITPTQTPNYLAQQSMTYVCELPTGDELTEAIMNRSDILPALAKMYGCEEKNILVDVVQQQDVSAIKEATLTIVVNSDMTMDATIKFSPSIENPDSYSIGYSPNYTGIGWLDTISLKLTEEEREKVMEAAAQQKENIIEQMKQFKGEWQYLPLPKQENRLLEKGERLPDRTPEPNEKPKPKRQHDDMER